MTFNGTIFTSTCHKAANSMAKLIIQSCGEWQLAVCLSRRDGAIWRWHEHLWMSNKPQKQATAKAAWTTFSTNTWLNSQLMYTAIVEASFSQIRSHNMLCYGVLIFYIFNYAQYNAHEKTCASFYIMLAWITTIITKVNKDC